MASCSYFSSTMKHSRVGVVSAGPAIVDITEEKPRRVTVLCLLELDIRATYLVVWGRPLPAGIDSGGRGTPQVGTQGLAPAPPGVCG